MRRVDPGTFSFLQPGWWVWHAVAISSMVALGFSLKDKIGRR